MASISELLRAAFKRASAYITMTTPWERQPLWFPHDFDSLVTEGYSKSELVFACIGLVADAVASATLRVVDGEGEELPDHPLRKLIEEPCRGLKYDEPDFWELSTIMLHIAGVAYWEKERAERGNVVALWPLRPDLVKVVPGARGISHYLVGPNDEVVPEADMLRFAFHNPLSPFEPLSPLVVAARQVNVDLDLQAYVKLLFQNNAVPLGVLTTEQYLAQPEADSLAEQWEKRHGGDRRGRIAVLGKGAKYQSVGAQLSDLDMNGVSQLSESRICMAFGVPPILVGAMAGLEQSTYSNFESSLSHFQHGKVMSVLRRLKGQVQSELAPDFGTGIEVEWDQSSSWALQLETREERKFWLSALQAGAPITVDEWREKVGLNPLPEGGDELLSQPQAAEPEPREDDEPDESSKALGLDDVPDEYAGEAAEWALCPEWMQERALRMRAEIADTWSALGARSVQNIEAISDEEWEAATRGESLVLAEPKGRA